MGGLTQRVKMLKGSIDREEPSLSTAFIKEEWDALYPGSSLEKRRREFYRFCLNRLDTPVYTGELIVGTFPYKEIGSNSPALPDIYTEGERIAIDMEAAKLYASYKGEDCEIPDYTISREMYYAEVNWGHIIVDYEKVLNMGLGGIEAEIKASLDMPCKTPEQVFFLECALESLTGVQEYILRYGMRVRVIAREVAGEASRELEAIASLCEGIAKSPPNSLWEALQLLWFVQMGLEIESGVSAFSYGRLDQYLLPFYQNDIERGVLDRERAKELLCCFWIKNDACPARISDAGRAVTLGGMTGVGGDGTNELTYLILELAEELSLFQPKLNARIWHKSPEEYIMACCRVCRKNIGPMMYNDESVIEALTEYGYSWRESVEYGIVGCYEYSLPGAERSSPMGCRIHAAKCFELAMNNGRSMTSGVLLGKELGFLDEYQTYEEVEAAFEKQFSYIVDKTALSLAYSECVHRLKRPHPFQSALVNDCIESGLDISSGGARYTTFGVRLPGLVDIADSLTAIRELVFERGDLSLVEIWEGIRTDFAQNPALRAVLKNKAPKYGNDIDKADLMMRELCEYVCRTIGSVEHITEQRLKPGLFSFRDFMTGENVSALPSGRRKAAPFANGISPSHGADRHGPTAALNSAAKLNYTLSNNGATFDLKLPADTAEGEAGIALIRDMVRAFFRQGGAHLQLYFLSAEDLLQARKTPELYPNLVVRVTGYSANFIELSSNVQDEVIMRTASF